ncbi:hypothetical protein E2C01_030365 [Portunus trituberculatus]|uniref:Uncharacterized protein n=1 Tax=Portunus trituberculatus TaxID=210409 RepID=A0A5B7EUN6_PORTR|nr:hypothetical protein [Portunus trituberculatus]
MRCKHILPGIWHWQLGSDCEGVRDYRGNDHNFFHYFFLHVCKVRMLKDRCNFNCMKVCLTLRSNGITVKKTVKLACVKIKITDCICFLEKEMHLMSHQI